MSGKGSDSRPMEIQREQFEANRDRIWPPTPKHCLACGYVPAWCICTDDGPGQENEATETKEGEP